MDSSRRTNSANSSPAHHFNSSLRNNAGNASECPVRRGRGTHTLATPPPRSLLADRVSLLLIAFPFPTPHTPVRLSSALLPLLRKLTLILSPAQMDSHRRRRLLRPRRGSAFNFFCPAPTCTFEAFLLPSITYELSALRIASSGCPPPHRFRCLSFLNIRYNSTFASVPSLLHSADDPAPSSQVWAPFCRKFAFPFFTPELSSPFHAFLHRLSAIKASVRAFTALKRSSRTSSPLVPSPTSSRPVLDLAVRLLVRRSAEGHLDAAPMS
jgi:hypothetical protein